MAHYQFIKNADGPFTYLFATDESLALVRDKFGARKGIFGHNPGGDRYPPFWAMATDLSALEVVGANMCVEEPQPGKPIIFYKTERSRKEVFILDVDDIRAIINDIGSKISNPDEQFKKINYILERNYCIHLPSGLKYASTEKFGDIVSSPLVYERAINAILKKRILQGETKVIIKNPRALYRIGILGYNETIRLDLTVEGNVGNFFAASCNFDGVWIVKGNAENGLADKGYKGKIVVEGFATELAGQNNQATEFSNGVDPVILDRIFLY